MNKATRSKLAKVAKTLGDLDPTDTEVPIDDLKSAIDDAITEVTDIRDEEQEKVDNAPNETMAAKFEESVEALTSAIDELEGILPMDDDTDREEVADRISEFCDSITGV